MAKSLKALVKMDDYATTASTGGIVEQIIITDTVLDEQTDLGVDQLGNKVEKYDYVGDKTEANGYKFIPCADEVQVGWIYQDKTGELRDPNSQYKYINKVIASTGASSIPQKGLTGDKNGR